MIPVFIDTTGWTLADRLTVAGFYTVLFVVVVVVIIYDWRKERKHKAWLAKQWDDYVKRMKGWEK